MVASRDVHIKSTLAAKGELTHQIRTRGAPRIEANTGGGKERPTRTLVPLKLRNSVSAAWGFRSTVEQNNDPKQAMYTRDTYRGVLLWVQHTHNSEYKYLAQYTVFAIVESRIRTFCEPCSRRQLYSAGGRKGGGYLQCYIACAALYRAPYTLRGGKTTNRPTLDFGRGQPR